LRPKSVSFSSSFSTPFASIVDYLRAKMGYIILPALVPDIQRVYELYFAAFDNDEMGRLMTKILFPSGITDEFRKAHTTSTLEWWNHCTYQYTVKCVDTETGDIVGMALGDIFFKERPKEERQNPGCLWLQGKERERADSILNPLWEAKEQVLGGMPHLCTCCAPRRNQIHF
jgi:hypothetical protein